MIPPIDRRPAIVLANGRFQTPNGKVAHGLVRGSERFEVLAVVDPASSGHDAGEVLDGRRRDIPIVASIGEALAGCRQRPQYCIVGVATHGGRFTDELRGLLAEAVGRDLSIVNGLHDCAGEITEIAGAAAARGLEIIDIRRQPPVSELHFWHGEVNEIEAPRVAVLGTDCAIGKRTTTRLLVQALEASGTRAEMIYTGQTGWMQGARFGFVLDALPNDYVAGELEHALLACVREANPEVMVIEGQSSLRNPSGPCGAELLLSGGTRGVVLQHAVGREHFEGYEALGLRIPPVADEVELIRFYGASTLAVALNGERVSRDELMRTRDALREELGIPVVCPLEDGAGELAETVNQYVARERESAGAP